jgi:hypothetical protein
MSYPLRVDRRSFSWILAEARGRSIGPVCQPILALVRRDGNECLREARHVVNPRSASETCKSAGLQRFRRSGIRRNK